MSQYLIPTYTCDTCDYICDRSERQCPVCKLSLREATQILWRSVSVATDEELEARMVAELDSNSRPIMVENGTRYELRVNESTGEVYSYPVPVMVPKMRSLTTQELAELKEQRDRSLDQLESIAVKEV